MACNHNCSTCKEKCEKPTNLVVKTLEENKIKKIIAVTSGKGGVGKSTVTSLLAVGLAKKGYKVGILDADITGPSIPKAFGVTDDVRGNDRAMFPPVSKGGIKVISVNLLIDDPKKPVLWRGPMINSAVKQFYSEVLWDELDFLFVDMPPGTGDVQMTVFQSLPIDGAIIVSTPQDLVSMIVGKAVKMAGMMNIPILGIVENMSYLECPDCGKRIEVFGSSKVEKTAKDFDIKTTAKLPINPEFAKLADNG
jgi:Mrp family chromosome partitioning ATPase